MTIMNDLKPSVSGLTEEKPKIQKMLSRTITFFLNYDMFRSKKILKQELYYMHRKLNVRECEHFIMLNLKRNVWCSFSSAFSEKVLLGCI